MAKNKSATGGAAKLDYQALKRELDEVMAELQRDDLDVDAALTRYKQGLELVRQLEIYLKTAENEVRDLNVAFDSKAKA